MPESIMKKKIASFCISKEASEFAYLPRLQGNFKRELLC